MKVNYDLSKDYEIMKFNDRLRVWEGCHNEEADYVLANGYIAPVSSGYYQAKVLIIGVIDNNHIKYYRAHKK